MEPPVERGSSDDAESHDPSARIGQRQDAAIGEMETRAAKMQKELYVSVQQKHANELSGMETTVAQELAEAAEENTAEVTKFREALAEAQEEAGKSKEEAAAGMAELKRALTTATVLRGEAEASRAAVVAAAEQAKAGADQRLVAARAEGVAALATEKEAAASSRKERLEEDVKKLEAAKARIRKEAEAEAEAARLVHDNQLKVMRTALLKRHDQRIAHDAKLKEAALRRFLQRVMDIANEIDAIAKEIEPQSEPQSERVDKLLEQNTGVKKALAGSEDDEQRMQSVLTKVLGSNVGGPDLWRTIGGKAREARGTIPADGWLQKRRADSSSSGDDDADEQEAEKRSFPEGAYDKDQGYVGSDEEVDEDEYIPSFGRPLLF